VLARIGGAMPDPLRRWALKPFRFTVQERIGD
jgi:hypothetical protein